MFVIYYNKTWLFCIFNTISEPVTSQSSQQSINDLESIDSKSFIGDDETIHDQPPNHHQMTISKWKHDSLFKTISKLNQQIINLQSPNSLLLESI